MTAYNKGAMIAPIPQTLDDGVKTVVTNAINQALDTEQTPITMPTNVDFAELVASFATATAEQVANLGLLALTNLNHVLVLDENIQIYHGNEPRTISTQGKFGLVLTDTKGEPVNLLVLDDKTTAINSKSGCFVLGNSQANTAYLLAGVSQAIECYNALAKHNQDCLVVGCVKGHLAGVAMAWQHKKTLIHPVNHSLQDDTVKRLKNTYATIQTYIDPAQDLASQEPPIRTIRPNSFAYNGGRFVIDDESLYYEKTKDDEPQKTLLSGAIYIDGYTRDENGNNWGRLVRIYDHDKREHRVILPNALITAEKAEYRKLLADKGLFLSNHPKAKHLLDIYLQRHPNPTKYTTTNKLGWHDKAFLLPNKSFGAGNLILDHTPEHEYKSKGDLATWIDTISRPIAKQDRLVMAVSVALAGAVIKPLNVGNIGFHFVGASSIGKTLSIKIASSVWGQPSQFIRTWRATSNGLESVASLHNDGFLALDEIGEVNPYQIGDIVYMLGNGQGKSRMTKDGLTKPKYTWRTALLSTGETSIDELIRQTGKTIKAGQELRIINIQADAGAGYGILSQADSPQQASEIVSHLENALTDNYGTAGLAWLDYLTQDLSRINHIKHTMSDIIAQYDDLPSQQKRVLKRFALVAGVGELATQAGLTCWEQGTATRAVMACFSDWLGYYGRDDLETRALIENISRAIEKYQYSRFIDLTDGNANIATNNHTGECLGYICKIKDEVFYCFYKSGLLECTKGTNTQQSLKILKSKNLLAFNHGNQYQIYIGRKRLACLYAISEKILNFYHEIS